MLKSIKGSLKDTLIYGLGNVAVKVVGLILIPLYVNDKYFSDDDFGILGLLEISGLLLTAALASGLPQGMARWYWDKNHKDNQKGIFFMSFASQLIISTLFCLVLIPLSDALSLLIFSKPDWSLVIKLVILSSAIQAINNLVNTLMRMQSKSFLYSVTNLMKLAIVLSLTLYFILVKKMGLEGIFLAQVIGNGVIVIALAGYIVKNSILFFDKEILRSMNIYGYPLLIANISAAALTVIDRYSLNSMDVLKSVALYTLAFKITSVLKLVFADSIKLAIGPRMIKKMNAPDNQRFYSEALLYSSYVMMIAIISVSMFSFEAIKLIDKTKDFWQSVSIIPILALSVFFVNMRDVTVYGLHLAKKTSIISMIVVTSTIIGLALNILLIPVWSITGAALATLLSQIFYMSAVYFFSQRAFYVPYEIKKIAVLFFTGAIISFSALLFNDIDLFPRLLIKTACILSFPFLLFLLNFYEPVELQAIKGFVNKWSKLKNLRNNIKSLKGIADEL